MNSNSIENIFNPLEDKFKNEYITNKELMLSSGLILKGQLRSVFNNQKVTYIIHYQSNNLISNYQIYNNSPLKWGISVREHNAFIVDISSVESFKLNDFELIDNKNIIDNNLISFNVNRQSHEREKLVQLEDQKEITICIKYNKEKINKNANFKIFENQAIFVNTLDLIESLKQSMIDEFEKFSDNIIKIVESKGLINFKTLIIHSHENTIFNPFGLKKYKILYRMFIVPLLLDLDENKVYEKFLEIKRNIYDKLQLATILKQEKIHDINDLISFVSNYK